MPAFAIRYEKRWEEDLKRLGLYGPNFGEFWRPIEAFVAATPGAGAPILDGSGARGFLTEEENFADVPKLVVYFKADYDAERLVFLGCDSASTPSDFPPEDWTS